MLIGLGSVCQASSTFLPVILHFSKGFEASKADHAGALHHVFRLSPGLFDHSYVAVYSVGLRDPSTQPPLFSRSAFTCSPANLIVCTLSGALHIHWASNPETSLDWLLLGPATAVL